MIAFEPDPDDGLQRGAERVGAALALLAAHPGPDIDLLAAAALLDIVPDEAGRCLGLLVQRHLLVEDRHRRYRLHDLALASVRRNALATITVEQLRQAHHRLLRFYLRATERADGAITPHRFRMQTAAEHTDAVLPPGLDDYEAALAWLTTERHNLAAVCTTAGEQGYDTACWRLAYALRGFYYIAKPWNEWITTHRAALLATQRLGDPRAESATRSNLGLAYLELGRFDAAAEQYRLAIGLAARNGDRHGAQTAKANHSWVRFSQRRFEQFLVEIGPAYDFYVSIGARRNAAITLRGIGLAEGELGRIDDAVRHLGKAYNVFTELDLRLDATMTLNALGDSYRRVGHAAAAVNAYAQGLAAAAHCGSTFEAARAHHRLGELARRSGDGVAAVRHWRNAVIGYQSLGAVEADEVRGLLDGAS